MNPLKRLFGLSPLYSLRKSTHILKHYYHLFQKKKKKLSPSQTDAISHCLSSLQAAILDKDRAKADEWAKKAQQIGQEYLRKSSFEQSRDLIFALAIALCVAVVIRQAWFEFYEIPTGSMRPTLKEKDRLVVSKTPFGINIPLVPDHLCFFPSLVKRNGIVVFTGEDMDIRDVDTKYFYIFPGKKQYIKRMIGKPGDTLYFYGGMIYGMDAEGHDITKELQEVRLDRIDHIPFIHFDGKVFTPNHPVNGVYSPVVLNQMNEPIAKLYVTGQHQVCGEMLPLHLEQRPLPPLVKDYGDLWGIKNFGMARLLTKEQAKQFTDEPIRVLPEGALYLEIKHHPSLHNLKLSRDERGRLRPMLGLSTSLIPLQEKHLRALFNSLYTARFVVKNGFAHRYGLSEANHNNPFQPRLPGVPNGTYEFYYGKAYEVLWEGITKELPSNHPLYQFNLERIQFFYNLGIEFDTRFCPQNKSQLLFPSRYVYFRSGDLYLLGSPILDKTDAVLIDFLQREYQKQSISSQQYPYVPFEDLGPPLKSDGSLNIEFLQQYGLNIPPKSYLVLGDNHAMSADSRDFGFVPENNLRGAPDWIFWPPGPRWGVPNQPSYPFFTWPRTIIWFVAAIAIGCGVGYVRRKNRLPFLFEQKKD
jgi:signal peptidase I